MSISAKSTISSYFRLISFSVMPRIAAFSRMFSRPLSCGWKPAPVAISPAIRPRVRTVPTSGRITPLIIFSSVDLPEPLRPIRPIDSPALTLKETSSTALKVSLILRPLSIATVTCLKVRW